MAVQNFGSGGGGQQLSPGVNISEIDLTTVVPQVATTVGGFAGVFRWGPIEQRTLITSENELVDVFGRPTNMNPETWFTAANFLSYSNALYVVRAANTSTVVAAIANTNGTASITNTVKNDDDFDTKTFSSGVHYAARWAGDIGNSLKVSVCENASQYSSNIATSFSNSTVVTNTATSVASISVGNRFINAVVSYVIVSSPGADTAPEAISVTDSAVRSKLTVGDYIEVGNSTIGKQQLKVTSIGGVNAVTDGGFAGITWFRIGVDQPLKIKSSASSNSINRYWEYYNQVDSAPGQSTWQGINGNTSANDEMHIVIADQDGAFTSSPGAILEIYKGVSRATDAKLADGSTNYYKNVLKDRSKYVWPANDRNTGDSNTGINLASSSNTLPFTLSFRGGVDEDAVTTSFADIARGYDLFASSDEVDISLLMTGRSRDGTYGEQLANYLIDNIAEVRKDCLVFVSPTSADVVNAGVSAADNVVEFRSALRSSSYAVMDSGYKYQYDKYNDIYRWIPLNGDIAGLCVRTDSVRDPWYSPAGINRGQVKNVVKLAFNPNPAQRDLLYKNSINPVISQRGDGVILNGDKTLLDRPSAFDRINVRRLFIVLEKAISRAAKSFLFEFNDEFTRAQFRNIVEPYLRDIQGRRGIYDFRVICDSTNNTPEVIDANRFVGDIYIKPARSINFIQLNFVAVRSGIEFSEIVG